MAEASFTLLAQGLQIDWNPILWVGGVFLAVISGLLTWIAVLIRQDKQEVNLRLEKHEDWILQQQKDLAEMSQKTTVAIELIKQEQKQGQERLKIFQENFFKYKEKKKND